MRIQVELSRKSQDKFVKEVVAEIIDFKENFMEQLALETAKTMKAKITESVKRPGSTGNLAQSIFALKTAEGWGVGDIDYLNKKAPYWRHVNSGSEAIGANWQHLVPKGSFHPGLPRPDSSAFREGRWVTNLSDGEGKTYAFIPKKPIPPMNYIEKTLNELNSIISHVKTISKGR